MDACRKWTEGRQSGNPLSMHALPMKKLPERSASIASALRTVATEQAGMAALAAALDNGLSDAFARAVELISPITGRVIVTGVGKSGHIGAKIAATLASTGTPGLLRASCRGQSRRPRHDRQGRCHRRHVMVGRKRRAEEHRRLFQALLHPADRGHLGRNLGAGARGRCGAASAARSGGLSERPCADHIDAAATRRRRCAGCRAA